MPSFDFKTYTGAGELLQQRGLTQAVKVGQTVHISGQGGWDSELKVVENPKSQIELAFKNVGLAVASAGAKGGLQDVFKITVFCTDLDACIDPLRAVVNDVWNGVVPPLTVIGVAKLAFPNMLVEIEALAWVE